MTNAQPYLPILKFKQAEIGALKDLAPDERQKLTPLIQLVPKLTRVNSKPPIYESIPREKVLKGALSAIQKYLSDVKVYLDSSILYDSERNGVLEAISNCSNLFGNNIVPVLSLTDVKTDSYDTNVLNFISQQGICLRVHESEVNNQFWQNIASLLSKLRIRRERVDLLLDYQVTDLAKEDSIVALVSDVDKIRNWRSLYLASGAFPEDLTKLTVGTNKLPRNDWKLWSSVAGKINGVRQLGFSDYTIQSAVYIPPVNNPNTSFSVRYATPDEWIIMRGQARNAKNSSGIKQYYAHAIMLKNQGLCDEKCCKGDEYISKVSKNPAGEGSAPKWLRVGINHHIAITLKQVDSTN